MEKPQELINTEERIADKESTVNLLREAMRQLNIMKELLAQGEQRLNANTELLGQSSEDIHVLLAFIKSKGLKPPKIHTA